MALDFTALDTAITNLNQAVVNIQTKVILLEDGQTTEEDQNHINSVTTSVAAAVTTLNNLVASSLEAE